MKNTISEKFPYESKYLDVLGSKMHYIEEGEGDPILFLHGNPTSSYLWRNVIPHLVNQGRCIALDLIGMGKSDKPNLNYIFDDHYDYLEAFINKLELKNITLVVHDWGSGLGFHYANNYRSNVKAIAFMEAIYKPIDWNDFPSNLVTPFKMMRTPVIGWLMLNAGNLFIKKVMPDTIARKLTKYELDQYKKPFPTLKSRNPIRVWPTEIPISGKPERMVNYISAYYQWLKDSEIPKICLYANPGILLTDKDVAHIRSNFKNTKMVDIGTGYHYIQEDNPHGIGKAISKWYNTI